MKVEWIKILGRPLSAQAKLKANYVSHIRECARRRFPKPWTGDVSVQVFYVLDRRAGPPPDLDNLNKLLLDALKSIAYSDDSQIRSCKSERFYSGERVVSSAHIMPPADELQKTAQLKKEQCSYVGITDVLL